MLCRPRGGRASPRYHHIRDAAEQKYFAAIEKREEEKPLTKAEVYILALTAMAVKATEEIRSLKLRVTK
jgi:hypothetical protein